MLVLLQTPLILRPKSLPFLVFSKKSDHPKPTSASGPKPRSPNRRLKAEPLSQKPVESKKKQEDDVEFPKTIPRKPRRGRRSEAAAVEDYVRESLEKTFASIREQDSALIIFIIGSSFRDYKATDNWKALKELEKAVKVYWEAKDRLPPRSVKIDMNIERDLAYALNVKECPQILFLRGNRILYREKEIRTADELVQMIAHFYYNAKRPSWIDVSALSPPYPY
uniref:Uncharacterized protein n=1 Tax=Cannabis sativa TaxID=3483 RepID=A0A803PGK2_CANSA